MAGRVHWPCRAPRVIVASALAFLLCPSGVNGQIFESVGTRALGMGGAFVGVADDATAVYWNPAGLGSGATFDLAFGQSLTEQVRGRGQATGPQSAASGGPSTFFGLVMPSFGVSYYRLRSSGVAVPPNPTAGGRPDRQDHRNQGAVVSSLTTDQIGVTLVQSLLDGLVVGATARLVRGVAAIQPVITEQPPEALLDDAGRLGGQVSTKGDLDAGAMVNVGSFRFGMAARNLFEPHFETSSGALVTHRQVRLGAAVTPGLVAADRAVDERGLIIALDIDVTRTPTAVGDRRDAAIGVERWWHHRRLGTRGGVRASIVGAPRPVGAVGLSVGVLRGVLVEGEICRGGEDADRGWSVSGRLTF
jgi:F plasmid transfer operon, TraF, protein